MVPADELDRATAEPELDAASLLATADDREFGRLGEGSQELVVLAEAAGELVRIPAETGGDLRDALGDRHPLEVDDAAAARARCDVAHVCGEAVREVEQGMGLARQTATLGKAEGWAQVGGDERPSAALLEEQVTRGRRPERAGHDENVSRAGAPSTGHPLGSSEGCDAEVDPIRRCHVAPEHCDARLRNARVELENVLHGGVGRDTQTHEEPIRLGARGGEIAQVHGRGLVAEVAPRRPVEPEVNTLEERVLRGDEAAREPSRVVLDVMRETPSLQLGQETEFAQLREPRRAGHAGVRGYHRFVKARYDGLAGWYDDFVRQPGLTDASLAELGRLLGAGRGRLLDLGCGTGVAFLTLEELGWSVTGVDISADQLRVARERGHDVLLADGRALPFADATFDAVASLFTHTDFDDVEAVFREVARVLRPGGCFAYVGPHPCFLAPTVERHSGEPYLLHAGYRQRGWWHEAPGFRLGREGIRGRAGVNHLPLADFLNAILDAGLRLERVEEPGDEDYPLTIGIRAAK